MKSNPCSIYVLPYNVLAAISSVVFELPFPKSKVINSPDCQKEISAPFRNSYLESIVEVENRILLIIFQKYRNVRKRIELKV